MEAGWRHHDDLSDQRAIEQRQYDTEAELSNESEALEAPGNSLLRPHGAHRGRSDTGEWGHK
jgi:hypothetical protein